MADIFRFFLLLVAGFYIVLRGVKLIKTKQAILDPMEKVAMFILRSMGKTEDAENREKELLEKKDPLKLGRNSVIFGGLVLLMSIVDLIATIYFEMNNP